MTLKTSWKELAVQCGIAVVYFLAAIVALNFAAIEGRNAILWPSSGVALAALIKFGPRYAAGVLLGAFATGIYASTPHFISAWMILGNTLEPLLALYLLRLFSFSKALHNVNDYLFLIFAGSIASIASALLGNYSLFMAGFITLTEFPSAFINWWMGDVLGIILITPCLLLFSYYAFINDLKRHRLEVLLLIVLSSVTALTVLTNWNAWLIPELNNSYLLAIPLAWSILRFGKTTTSLITALYLIIAIWGLLYKQGIFVDDLLHPHLIQFWSYFVVLSLVSMIMAYNIGERNILYQAINNSQMETYIFCEDDMRFTFANNAALNNLGLSLVEVLKLTPLDLKPLYSEDGYRDFLKWLPNKNHTAVSFEAVHQRKDGSTYPVEVQLQAVEDSNRHYYLTSVIDISKRKKVEQELRKNQEQLLQLNEDLDNLVLSEIKKNHKKDLLLQEKNKLAAMGEMIGNIAHQWRQPLNGLNLILRDLEDASIHNECDTEYLNRAVKEANKLIVHMSQTIDNFRGFFQQDSGQLVQFNVKQVIDECVTLLAATFKFNHINVSVECIKENLTLSANKHEFSEVILNILGNAQEAILKNNSDEGAIDIVIKAVDKNLIVSICDNGGGISTDVLPKIFDPYFTNKDQGTGMGLYMSRMIIENHMNGRITVESQNKNTCFLIYIPQ